MSAVIAACRLYNESCARFQKLSNRSRDFTRHILKQTLRLVCVLFELLGRNQCKTISKGTCIIWNFTVLNRLLLWQVRDSYDNLRSLLRWEKCPELLKVLSNSDELLQVLPSLLRFVVLKLPISGSRPPDLAFTKLDMEGAALPGGGNQYMLKGPIFEPIYRIRVTTWPGLGNEAPANIAQLEDIEWQEL